MRRRKIASDYARHLQKKHGISLRVAKRRHARVLRAPHRAGRLLDGRVWDQMPEAML